MKNPVLSASAALLGLAVASPAFAHARLVAAHPAMNGDVRGTPARLHLQFSEAVAVRLSGVSVAAADGKLLPVTVGIDQGGRGVAVMPKQPLRPGAYTVNWHAVASDDGHRTAGAYRFTVR